MFDAFSSRSRIVVFGARIAAGERGSTAIDTEDLLIGLIREDLGMNGAMRSKLAGEKENAIFVLPEPTHKRFFDPAVAATLLKNIKESIPHREPIATSTEIPLSDELSRVFEASEGYRTQFHHDQIEPLHLLAGVFSEVSRAVRELRTAGITEQEVLKHLGGLG